MTFGVFGTTFVVLVTTFGMLGLLLGGALRLTAAGRGFSARGGFTDVAGRRVGAASGIVASTPGTVKMAAQ
jgi:hypothetical protein